MEKKEDQRKMYIYNCIESQLDEIESLADAKEYIKDYMEDGDIHPDIESMIILQEIAYVSVEETGKETELNNETVPVCKVDIKQYHSSNDSVEGLREQYVNHFGGVVNFSGEEGDFTPKLLYEIWEWFLPRLQNHKSGLDILNEELDNSTLQKQQESDAWISVDDRLPEHGQEILAYEEGSGIQQMTYDENTDWVFTTHWMPLPKSPTIQIKQ